MEKAMLCFEVWKNDEKLTVAGLRESGVVSFELTWVGKGPGASALAAAADGDISGLDWRVGGIDSSDPTGDTNVEWVENPDLKLGDEVRVRLISADRADAPSRREQHKPPSRIEGETRFIQCSFCGQTRQTQPKRWLDAGVAGAEVFICTRCLILAERTLEDGLQHLFHLTRATDQTCSFCAAEHTAESVTAREAHMCRQCVDMMMA
jgi:hypothetical protein